MKSSGLVSGDLFKSVDEYFKKLGRSLFWYYGDGIVRYSKDGNEVLEVPLPGYRKEDLKVKVKDGIIRVSADIKKENKTSYFRKSFSESILIGDDVRSEDMKVSYEDGILKFTWEKREDIEDKDYEVVVE